MQLHGEEKINGKTYRQGDNMPWYFVYPFFLTHMAVFGGSGFFMAYGGDGPDLAFLYLHGGFAYLVYTVFYSVLFGIDRIRWMFINAGLGLFGIYAQIDWILSGFGKRAADFPAAVHAIPAFYYVLYTFLLHQMVLDLFKARNDPTRRRVADAIYIVVSLLIYTSLWLGQR